MMGPTHRAWGAWQGLTLGGAVGGLWSPGAALSASLGWAGLGWLCATLPDRVERPLRLSHRGVSHWPEPPLVAGGLAVAAVHLGILPFIVGVVLLGGVANAWLSHWTGDFIFGKAHVRTNEAGKIVAVIRPRGVPYRFGTRYKGMGFKVDSDEEHTFRRALNFFFPLGVVGMLVYVFTMGG